MRRRDPGADDPARQARQRDAEKESVAEAMHHAQVDLSDVRTQGDLDVLRALLRPTSE